MNTKENVELCNDKRDELLKKVNSYLKEYYLCAKIGSKAIVLGGLDSLNSLIVEIQEELK